MQNRDALMVEATETPAQMICRLAKEAVHQSTRTDYLKKVEELRIFLTQGHAVDVGFFKKTPTMMLMEQSEENAAWMLVNQFGADAGGILYQYGRQHRFKELLALMEKFRWCYTQKWGVSGFVDGMDIKNAEHVQELYLLIDKTCEVKVQAGVAAVTLASNGNMAFALNLYLHYRLDINDLLRMYIAKGDMEEVNKFVWRYPEWLTDVAGLKVWYGYEKEASKEIEEGADINLIVYYAACLGKDMLVESLIARGASIDKAVTGYAVGGYTGKVDALLKKGASHECAFYGYRKGCHYSQIEKHMPASMHANLIDDQFKSGIDELRVLSFIQDRAKRKRAILYLPRAGDALLKQAEEINDLMRRFNLDYEQARLSQSDPKKNSMLYYLRLRKYQAASKTYFRMSYQQAYSCAHQAEMRAWLIQGKALVRDGFLNNDIVTLTASYVGNLPYDDGETLRINMTPKTRAPTLFNHLDLPSERGIKRNQVEEGDRKRRRPNKQGP